MGALVIAAALALFGCGSARPPASTVRVIAAHPRPPLTFPGDCIHDVVEPPEVVFACATGQAGVGHLTWRSWGGAVAWGDGLAHTDDCSPNCAEGGIHSAPAEIYLRAPTRCGTHEQYTHAVVIAAEGVVQPLTGAYYFPCPTKEALGPERAAPEYEDEAGDNAGPTEAEVRAELQQMKQVEREAKGN